MNSKKNDINIITFDYFYYYIYIIIYFLEF